MDWYYIVLAVFLSLLILVFFTRVFLNFCLLPGKTRSGIEKFKVIKFAHRGLHNEEHAENSLSAFALAKDLKFGIELDVRLSSDGQLVVFHDPNLKRVCGIDKKVVECTVDELANVKLAGTDEGVPTFRQVLNLINGEIPMLIEIKSDFGEKGVAEKFLEEIKDYKGEYIVESFNPLALKKVKNSRPDIIRGILSMEFSKDEKYKGKFLYTLMEKLYFNFLCRPDFIAYGKNGYKVKNLQFIRRSFATPLFAWTVQSEEEEKEAVRRGFDTVIFENYIPKK